MRSAFLSLLLASVSLSSASADPFAAHDAERAAVRLHRYATLEYPAEIRRLRSEISFTTAQIDALKQQLAEYRPFSKFQTGGPVNAEIRWLRLEIYAAELRLYNLREHYYAIQRVHPARLNQMAIAAQ